MNKAEGLNKYINNNTMHSKSAILHKMIDTIILLSNRILKTNKPNEVFNMSNKIVQIIDIVTDSIRPENSINIKFITLMSNSRNYAIRSIYKEDYKKEFEKLVREFTKLKNIM